jgi:Ca-activated chloride channel family protein
MKRNIITILCLLAVAQWLVACTTPQSPTKLPQETPEQQPKTEEEQSANVSNSTNELAVPQPQVTIVVPLKEKKQPQSKTDGSKIDADVSKIGAVESTVSSARQERKRESGSIGQVGKSEPRFKILADRSSPAAKLSASRPALMLRATGVAPGLPPNIRFPSEPLDRENYAHFDDNPVLRVAEKPVSTFSIDVDTGSYTNTRRILQEGRLPAKDVVRVEEFINYFNYDYPAPENTTVPFNVVTEVGPTPWNAKTHLLHIGIKGYQAPQTALPPSNLVFLVDVSGSMQSANKLPLLKKSLQLLTQKLRAQDKISLVVYAGASGVVLEPTPGSDKATILTALESLSAGGSTNGAAGIRLAYLKAQQSFIKGGINRVILATDGDFNVGTVNFDALKNLVEDKRKTGIYLTTLGFGAGNYNDNLMEQLADSGNGNYAYIDTLMEAQKVLVNEMGSTLNTIAKDVKIQIEFNPVVVSEYRLIGYENRSLRREDFNNDKIDAGEIGAGHTVTAIYEIALTGKGGQLTDPLRYQSSAQREAANSKQHKELAFLRLRYKKPDSDKSILMETPVLKSQMIVQLNNTSDRFQFAASVAGFGQLLRGGRFTKHYSYGDVVSIAVNAKGIDRYGYRSEFVRLVELANTLSGNAQLTPMDKAFN